MIHFIALSKGELGKEIEVYLKNYGLNIKLDGRPLQFVQSIDNRIFRPMQSKDVPWYVVSKADYGVVGEDLVTAYTLEKNNDIKILDRLDFGKGDLVIFSKKPMYQIKKRGNPKLAVPSYYSSFVKRGSVGKYMNEEFPGFDIDTDLFEVSGSTEGFVADGTADLGFDFTTYFRKNTGDFNQTTIEKNGLKIAEKIMPTEAVVISKNSEDFTIKKFEEMLNGPWNLDWKKMKGNIPVILQDYDTNDALMMKYVNQISLEEISNRRSIAFDYLGVYGSESFAVEVKELFYDCDGDAILCKLSPYKGGCTYKSKFKSIITQVNDVDWQEYLFEKYRVKLIPTIVQNEFTKDVLMMAYVDKDALEMTLKNRYATFWSRSKNRLWKKGEESGNVLNTKQILYDKEDKTLLYMVKPVGVTCHTGNSSCFYREIELK